MTISLIDTLKQDEDFCSARGKRCPLWVVLLVTLSMTDQCNASRPPRLQLQAGKSPNRSTGQWQTDSLAHLLLH
ncbi:MAG: hypothetical protein HC895_21095 [Leptolyngbyaceae cyanobacterium SM1_3_5]|nr:hypothetical protein [Leptolyngbyaceae cyanobacterium SM1_3_5]